MRTFLGASPLAVLCSWFESRYPSFAIVELRLQYLSRVWSSVGNSPLSSLRLLGAPPFKCDDRRTQGDAAIGQRVGPGVVSEGQSLQDAGCFELAQAGSEHVRAHSEVTLQITVSLRPLEQSLHDEEGPPRSDDLEGGGEVAHVSGSVSGFIQNGE